MACATLEAFGARLCACKGAVLALLPQGGHAAIEAFYARTVGAAGRKAFTSCLMRLVQAFCVALERAALQNWPSALLQQLNK